MVWTLLPELTLVSVLNMTLPVRVTTSTCWRGPRDQVLRQVRADLDRPAMRNEHEQPDARGSISWV